MGLREYAANHLTKAGVCLVRGIVKEVEKERIVLTDGTEVPYGILVWSTGVGPSELGIDHWLRVPSVQDVFALGDCAGFMEETRKKVTRPLGLECQLCWTVADSNKVFQAYEKGNGMLTDRMIGYF